MTTVSTGTTMYFLFFLIFMAAKNVNLSRLMKIACWVQGISVFAIIGLSQLGIIEDHIFDPNERIRHGLGFSWTTLGPSLVFFFMMTYLPISVMALFTNVRWTPIKHKDAKKIKEI